MRRFAQRFQSGHDYRLFTVHRLHQVGEYFNHFRKHLHGAYLQRIDMMTVPSICRNDHDPYDWRFDGEPQGGTVAVFS